MGEVVCKGDFAGEGEGLHAKFACESDVSRDDVAMLPVTAMSPELTTLYVVEILHSWAMLSVKATLQVKARFACEGYVSRGDVASDVACVDDVACDGDVACKDYVARGGDIAFVGDVVCKGDFVGEGEVCM